jgi:hypothetical protein
MQFRVPQFIDVEDKIFGPFTFKQFIYLAGGAGMCYILLRLLPTFIAILFIAPVAGLALALAFYRVNNKPFIEIIEAWFNYVRRGKLYLWKKEVRKGPSTKITPKSEAPTYVPHLSGSKLNDISWSLDVLDTERDRRT